MIDQELTIIDAATPFLQYMAQTKPDWMRKAMKSAGWMIQKEIKVGIRSGSPGGQAYAQFMPPDMRRKLEKAFGNRGKRKYVPLGKLANAVGYQYDQSKQSVKIGWLSGSAVKLGEKIESGSEKTITPKMRDYFFVSGVPLSAKEKLVIPARKTYGPMERQVQPKVAGYVEDKIFEYMQKGTPGPSTTRRKYRVRG